MRTVKYGVMAGLVVIAVLAVNVQAAFIVETDKGMIWGGGPPLAPDNYVGDGIESTWGTSRSLAVGTQAGNAVFGGTGDKTYTFSYTPSPGDCLDVDNVPFVAGTDLGRELASGLVGGGVGLYNVYATWCDSINLFENNANFVTTSEGDDVSLLNVQQFGTGPGSDDWLLIAERVLLVSGRTYTVTQTATDTTDYVAIRNHGVMWEFVEAAVPVADVIAAGGVVSVEEGGGSDQYTVVLKEQPPESIVVTAMVCEPNQITLDGQDTLELTFTPQNWNVEQVVDVAAVEDTVPEPVSSLWILHTTYPADANDVDPNSVWTDGYAGLITVDIRDFDVPGVRITETDGATEVSEEGPTSDSYMVRLLFAPTDNVKVVITTDGQTLVDTGSGAAETAELLFGLGDWSDDQPVTVTAVDDDVLEPAQSSQITHVCESLDGGYDGLTGRDVVVLVGDNECGLWGYSYYDRDEDCVVGLSDFAEFAAVWLECTQPFGDNCVDLR